MSRSVSVLGNRAIKALHLDSLSCAKLDHEHIFTHWKETSTADQHNYWTTGHPHSLLQLEQRPRRNHRPLRASVCVLAHTPAYACLSIQFWAFYFISLFFSTLSRKTTGLLRRYLCQRAPLNQCKRVFIHYHLVLTFSRGVVSVRVCVIYFRSSNISTSCTESSRYGLHLKTGTLDICSI